MSANSSAVVGLEETSEELSEAQQNVHEREFDQTQVVDHFYCEPCAGVFPCDSELERHQLLHAGEKPYVCFSCGLRFAGSDERKHHQSILNDETHECGKCEGRFGTLCAFERHRHGGCFGVSEEASASERTKLQELSVRRSEEEHFCCELCCRQFHNRSDWERHRRSHTGEKPFECAECKKRFTRNSHLKEHQVTHTDETPYACATCGKRFAHRSSLSKHRRLHAGEKPFCCLFCGRTFSRTDGLRDHILTHRGEKLTVSQGPTL